MRPVELINGGDIRGDGHKGPEKHTETQSVGGNEEPEHSQWRAQCKLSKWELNSLQRRFYRVNVERNTPTPPCKKKNKKTHKCSSHGSRWERSFTAGVSVRYRGHKSADWHRVSSVRQQSQTPGMFQSAGKQTSMTARDAENPRRPRTATGSTEIWDTAENDILYIKFLKKEKERQHHEWTSEKRNNICKWGLRVRDMGHMSPDNHAVTHTV